MTQTKYAEQAQGRGAGALAGAALIAAAIWFSSRQGAGGSNGNGGAPAGAAQVGGGITGVTVSQRAGMGQIDKAVGSSLTVQVSFNANTTKDGQRISWPYYVIIRIGHSTVFGWRTATDLGINFRDALGNTVDFPWASQQVDTSTTGTVQMPVLRIPNDPGVTYDVHVQLRAQQSDEFGNPNGVWMDVGSEFREDGAFTITPATSPASVGGSVSTVTVSQPPQPRQPGPASRRGIRVTGRR